MQTKLTLTVEQLLIEKGKEYARQQGRSLSDLVENYIRLLVKDQPSNITVSPEIEKMHGVISLPEDFDYKESLSSELQKKHK